MKKLLICCLSIVLFIPNILAYGEGSPSYSTDYDWAKYKGQNKTINVYNWGEYIDDETLDVNNEFTKLTGIKVNYTTFASNEELYARLKGGGVSYDVVIPSDYMVARLISEDMLEKLDHNNIPNGKFIDTNFVNQAHDPKSEYSIPYTWGTVGILYDSTVVTETVDSWDILWNEKYAGQILMFDNSRDAFGIALKKLGFSQNTTNTTELDLATKELIAQKNVIQAYVMDQIFDKMISGEAALAPYYAGDSITITKDNPNVKFTVPKEGTNKFIDSACIPKNSQNKELGEMYINFLNEPEIAKANIEYIGYSTPNTEAFELLDSEIKENEISYPSEKVLQNTEVFYHLPQDTLTYIDQKWLEIKGIGNSDSGKLAMPILLILALVVVLFTFWRKQKKKKEENY